jgi:hypothetical protein
MSSAIQTDILTRRLYATDASIYEEMPEGRFLSKKSE